MMELAAQLEPHGAGDKKLLRWPERRESGLIWLCPQTSCRDVSSLLFPAFVCADASHHSHFLA